jgi:hypothetical protein
LLVGGVGGGGTTRATDRYFLLESTIHTEGRDGFVFWLPHGMLSLQQGASLGRSAVCKLVIGWREFAMTDSEGLAAKSPALASRQGNDLGVDWPALRPIVVELGGLAKSGK